MKAHWERKLADAPQSKLQAAEHTQQDTSHHHHHHDDSVFHKAVDAVKHLKAGNHTEAHSSDVHGRYVQGWMDKVVAESSVGRLVEELLK